MTITIPVGRERNRELIDFYILVDNKYATTEEDRHD